MNYTIALPGFNNQNVEVQTGGFFSGPKLLINGQRAPKGEKRNQMLLYRDSGQEVVASWKHQFVDIPKLVVDGDVIDIVEPLRWYQWVWSGLPLILVFAGGLLGGVAGVIGMTINAKIFRTHMNGFLKFALTAAVSVIVTIIYIIAAALFVGLVQGGIG